MAVVLRSEDDAGQLNPREQEIQSRLAACAEDYYLQPSDIHVLLVDDEQLSRLVVGNLLRKCNYKVTVVESGPQALEILRRSVPGTFQLILTDVMMPQVDGLDLLRYVRSNSQLMDLPVIMMSANEHKATVFEAIKGGAEEYLVKPVTKKEVQNIWQYVWKRASATQTVEKGEVGAGSSRQPVHERGLPPPGYALAVRHSSASPPAPPQQLHQQQQERLAQQSQPTAGGGGDGSRAGKQGHLLLSRWLQRPNRVIDPKESVWVFCEVLLLLDKAEQAAGAAAVPPCLVRPSKLLLHSSGRVTFAPEAVAAVAAVGGSGPGRPQQRTPSEQQEEELYRSPEEEAAAAAPCTCPGADASSPPAVLRSIAGGSSSSAAAGQLQVCQQHAAGAALGPKCYSFSLGMLFFDLFWAPGEGARTRALQDLRQRVLPSPFLRQRPQEAAFVLALLHPDPAVRPGVAELISGDLLGGVCETLRARHATQHQARAAHESESLLFFLQTMQNHKQQEAALVQQQLVALDDSIRAAAGALSEVQGMVPPSGAVAAAAPHRAQHSSGSMVQVSLGSPRGPRQQQQQSLGNGHASASPSAAAAAQQEASDAADSDDEEEERREARAKRRRVQLHNSVPAKAGAAMLGAAQCSQTCTAPGSSGAAPGQPAAAGSLQVKMQQQQQQQPVKQAGQLLVAPDALRSQWEVVVNNFADLEALFFRRKQRWQLHQQAQAQINNAQPPTQQQQQQQDGQQPGAGTHPAGPPAAAAAAAGSLGDSSAAVAHLPGFLQRFSEDLANYSRYSRLVVRGYIRSNAEVLGASNLLCGLGLDRDEEYLATAGVSKRIRVYEYASVVGEGGVGPGGVSGLHYPVLDLASRSRLSSLAWSSYVKGHLASSDYEGVVQLWDVNTSQELMQFEEHAKRAWAVDFSPCDPSRLVSGSDDGTVKVWSIHQDTSVLTIGLHANVCSVQFAPDNPHLVAAGSANYRMYLYDLRHTAAPLAVATGHEKAVSYVRFLNGQTLVTASTDNSLRLWHLPELVAGAPDACELVMRGHTNEKNFIGLAVTPDGYIACGSETNEVFTYYQAVPRPVAHHSFVEGVESELDHMSAAAHGAALPSHHFVSCVAWSCKHRTLLAANSAGHLRVLEMA